MEVDIPPQVVWDRSSVCNIYLSAEDVRQISSNLIVDDGPPNHVNRLVAALADQQERGKPRLATADDLWRVRRIWQ